MRWGNIKKGKEPNYCKLWNPQLEKTIYDFDSIMHYLVDGFAKDKSDSPPCREEEYNGKLRFLAFKPHQDKLWQQEQEIGRPITIGQTDRLSKRDIEAIDMLYPGPPRGHPPPGSAEPCTITTTTVVQVGDRTKTTTRTEPCPPKPPPDRDRCCDVQRPHRPLCRPDTCRPVRVNWPRPIDGADRNGADHGHARALYATATAGAKVARLSTTGTNRISAARRTFSQRGEATPRGQIRLADRAQWCSQHAMQFSRICMLRRFAPCLFNAVEFRRVCMLGQ